MGSCSLNANQFRQSTVASQSPAAWQLMNIWLVDWRTVWHGGVTWCRRTGTLGCRRWTFHWWRCSNARCVITRRAPAHHPSWASRSSSRLRSRSVSDGWRSMTTVTTLEQWSQSQVSDSFNYSIRYDTMFCFEYSLTLDRWLWTSAARQPTTSSVIRSVE